MPSLHVFIAGVSEYSNLAAPGQPPGPGSLGLSKLSSPAISAFRIYEWLQNNQAALPLAIGDCQLLLSPSPQEAADTAMAAAAGQYQPCTLANFLKAAAAWRAAATNDPDGMTWFYFAGHGAQRYRNDAILLLQDFGQAGGGSLLNAVDVPTLFSGMAPSPKRPNICKKQLYFVDACRVQPEQFATIQIPTPTAVFDVELNGEDDRQAPIYFAAVSDSVAMGLQHEPSIFCQVLLSCLNGIAGDKVFFDDGRPPEWQVKASGLAAAMGNLFDDLNASGTDQTMTIGGLQRGDMTLCKLARPPMIDVSIAVDPNAAAPHVRMSVVNADTLVQVYGPGPIDPCPHFNKWEAGAYRIEIQVTPPLPYRGVTPHVRLLKPPTWIYNPRVAP